MLFTYAIVTIGTLNAFNTIDSINMEYLIDRIGTIATIDITSDARDPYSSGTFTSIDVLIEFSSSWLRRGLNTAEVVGSITIPSNHDVE